MQTDLGTLPTMSESDSLGLEDSWTCAPLTGPTVAAGMRRRNPNLENEGQVLTEYAALQGRRRHLAPL